MKTLCICWSVAASIVLLWPRPPSFKEHWPLLVQPAMSLELFNAAKKAAERPAFCTYVFNRCRIG
jgi:hypothetical protein